MADDLIKSNEPLPPGGTIGGSSLSLIKSNEPLPPGGTIGATVQTQPTQSGEPDTPMVSPFAQAGYNLLSGIAKGAESTASGVSSLLNKIPGVGETLAPSAGIAAMKEQATPHGVAQNLGYGGESLMEFMLGDEALQGLSLSEKLAKVSEVAKTLENSPRIMAALKAGAAAIRQGSVQGAITLAKTQDVKQALKEGGWMAALSAALGVPVEVLKSTLGDAAKGGEAYVKLSKQGENAATDKELIGRLKEYINQKSEARVAEHELGEAGQAEKALSTGVENTPDAKELGTGLQGKINDAETAMHQNFETGLQDIHGRLQGAELPQKGSPISNKAQELLDNPPVNTEGENETLTAARGAARDLLNPKVSALLDTAAKGEKEVEAATKPMLVDPSGNPIGGSAAKTQEFKPWTIEDLTAFRTKVRQLAQSFQPGDINARTLRQLIPSIDDTIEEMASKSGDTALSSDYKALRDTYRNTVKFFDKPEYKVIQKLQNTNPDDVSKIFLKNPSAIDNLDKLEEFFKRTQGKNAGAAMDEFTDNMFSNILKNASDKDTGIVDANKLLKEYNSIKEPVRDRIGKLVGGNFNARIQEALQNAETVSGAKEALETQSKNTFKVLGNLEAPREFLEGKGALERVETLRDLIGDKHTQEFSRNVFDTLLRDANNRVTGKFDAAKFIDQWQKLSPEIRDKFFNIGSNKAEIENLLKDAHMAKKAQILARAGLLGTVGGVTGGLSHWGAGLATVLGMTLGSGAGTIENARGILDYVADHPVTWKLFGAASKVAESKVTAAAGKGAKMALSKDLAGNQKGTSQKAGSAARRVMLGSKGPLGGE